MKLQLNSSALFYISRCFVWDVGWFQTVSPACPALIYGDKDLYKNMAFLHHEVDILLYIPILFDPLG